MKLNFHGKNLLTRNEKFRNSKFILMCIYVVSTFVTTNSKFILKTYPITHVYHCTPPSYSLDEFETKLKLYNFF